MTRQEYIKYYGGAVIDSVRGTTLFPSVKMAQAILESSSSTGDAGGSTLAKVYNNHFGIKANAFWRGKKVNLKTREVISGKDVVIGDYFRVYDNAGQSFKDHTKFLQQNQNYARHGVFTAATPEEQADALQEAGYATDPKYASTLKSLIKALNLKSLDELAKKNI
jgi:flagellum-specific peptidoglycan hydrolase FlgJ